MNLLDTTCPRCRTTLRLRADALLITTTDSRRTAWVICHSCADVVGRAVTDPAFAALVAGGCAVLADVRVAHPEERPDGATFDADDLIAMHEFLADDDAVASALHRLPAATEHDT